MDKIQRIISISPINLFSNESVHLATLSVVTLQVCKTPYLNDIMRIAIFYEKQRIGMYNNNR